VHRRQLLVGLAALVAAACGVRRDEQADGSPPAADPDASPTPDPPADEPADPDPVDPATLPPAPEAAGPYEPSPDETHPKAKLLGALVAQRLTTYDPGEPVEHVVDRAADGRSGGDDVTEAAVLVVDDGWSRGEVLYPQFGGLTEDACSIMAVTRQTIGQPEGRVTEVVRTIDVRLRLDDDGEWVFDHLASAGGDPVARPERLPPEADAVLDDDRIELPDSARWDIHAGHTDLAVLVVLHELAELVGAVGVCTLRNGHPVHVFGTDRVSDHTRGRAVDLHRLGGRFVIEDREEGSTTDEVVAWLYDHDLRPVVGSPWALDGFGGRSFTDPVHQDHLHVAVPDPVDEGLPADEELAP
jgi:hypothetical protein